MRGCLWSGRIWLLCSLASPSAETGVDSRNKYGIKSGRGSSRRGPPLIRRYGAAGSESTCPGLMERILKSAAAGFYLKTLLSGKYLDC